MAEVRKILFLYCGGTIGQIPREVEVNGKMQNVMFPPEGSEEFEQACRAALEKSEEIVDLDITFEMLFTKDSSNVTPADWKKIALRICEAQDEEAYQGVVVAHGTDTLAHTATALSFALHGDNAEKSGLALPVILTGAQNNIYTEGGDGLFNLLNAFRVVNECISLGVADVLVSFWSRVLLGCRSIKVSEKEFDAFRSPGFPDVGTVNSLGVTVRPDLIKRRSEASFRMRPMAEFSDNVLMFELSPGLRPEVVKSAVDSNGAQALILKSLGEGNIPTEEPYNFVPLVEHVTEKAGLPVIISSRFIGGYAGSAQYEVGLRAIEAGGIPGLDHSTIAAEVKTRWLIGNKLCNSVEGFKKAFATSYVGEVTD